MFNFDWFNRKKVKQLAQSLKEILNTNAKAQLAVVALQQELDNLHHSNLQSSLHYNNEIKTLREQLKTAELIMNGHKTYLVKVWGAEQLPNKVQSFGWYWKDLDQLLCDRQNKEIQLYVQTLKDNNTIFEPAKYLGYEPENTIYLGNPDLKPASNDKSDVKEIKKNKKVNSFEKSFPKRKK